MPTLYECDVCHAEYPSQLAATECEDADRIEDLNTRQYFHPGGRHADHR